MKYVFIIPLLLLSGFVSAQKARNYTDVTNDLSEKIVTAPFSITPLRLAVVPLTASKASMEASSQFGDYITETIIGNLSGHSQKIKLFERTRLDAILKEQEFILTDMMKPAAALKIGQLVPIDALLSGTYTKLKTYIDVSARLMDVASGEIIVSYNARIKIDKNIATLFKNNTGMSTKSDNAFTPGTSASGNITINNTINTGSSTAGKSKEEICKERVNEFSTRLNDLSSDDKINKVVSEAIKVPFDNQCGQLHYNVMYSFSRYKIDQPAYKSFLLNTLDTIAFPTEDDRVYSIVRYLSDDSKIDDKEWQAGFHALARISNYSLSTYINYLIAKPDPSTPDEAQMRIKAFFNLASSGKIGLPRPVTFEAAFFEMLEGVKSKPELGEYVYENYANRLELTDKNMAKIFTALTSQYKEEEQAARKTMIVTWIATFTKDHDYPKADEELYEFADHFMPDEYRNNEIDKEYNPLDLAILTSMCADKFAKYALITPYPNQKEDRINFCVKNNISIAGVIPTMAEAGTILTGNNAGEQLRVVKLLVQMNDKPKQIENQLIALLGKRSLDDRQKLSEAQYIAITIFGNIKTSNKTAIDYMIGTLPHYGNDTEASMAALVKIGKPAVSSLIARLDKTTDQDGGLQYQLITLLGKIGKDAAPAEKSIQRVLKINGNSDVQYAGEAALQTIK